MHQYIHFIATRLAHNYCSALPHSNTARTKLTVGVSEYAFFSVPAFPCKLVKRQETLSVTTKVLFQFKSLPLAKYRSNACKCSRFMGFIKDAARDDLCGIG